MPVLAYLALGSNLGDRTALLRRALEFLQQTPGIHVLKVSSFHETEPVGGPPGQEKYLNATAEIETSLSAPELLHHLQSIENQLGRVRQERFGPRTIDLDLLLFGPELIQTPELIVPHPRMHERLFVLEPLAEIAPLAVHPGLESTVRDLLRRLKTAPQRELAGQRALVTGSTSGIGMAIARELALGGADLLIHGRNNVAAAAVVQRIRSLQVGVAMHCCDLESPAARQALMDAAWPVDIWINNAGADTLTGAAAAWSFEQKLAALWAVDVQATIHLSRAIGRKMKDRGSGVIVNMGWDQAETGMEGDSGQLFAATKGAVMAFTKSLALTLAPEVRVNCLAPGWIRTAWGENASKTWQERVRHETPLARWGTPEDVAQVARWLVSPAAAFITGQVIRVNGGAVM